MTTVKEKTKSSTITIRISDIDRDKLATLSKAEGMTQTDYLTFLIRANYRDYKKEQEAKMDKYKRINPKDIEDGTIEKGFIVFEEDDNPKHAKTYDLCAGVCATLEDAKAYADAIHRSEAIYVADYAEYMSGNYNYLYEVK